MAASNMKAVKLRMRSIESTMLLLKYKMDVKTFAVTV